MYWIFLLVIRPLTRSSDNIDVIISSLHRDAVKFHRNTEADKFDEPVEPEFTTVTQFNCKKYSTDANRFDLLNRENRANKQTRYKSIDANTNRYCLTFRFLVSNLLGSSYRQCWEIIKNPEICFQNTGEICWFMDLYRMYCEAVC
jgi:hypothetical protein